MGTKYVMLFGFQIKTFAAILVAFTAFASDWDATFSTVEARSFWTADALSFIPFSTPSEIRAKWIMVSTSVREGGDKSRKDAKGSEERFEAHLLVGSFGVSRQ